MGDFRGLVAWQLAHQLVLEVYRATAAFPPEERFGLTSQLRRGAVSIASNLAEGAGRGTGNELRRFASISRGAVHELTCQLMIARDLGFLPSREAAHLLASADRIGRLLSGIVTPRK
ncbi:MAG: four helix bundle protein [Gemmatimonadales bacterium]|nr:four helix bundle protein [Gemmatimonadales bacterium]